jgi:hypothetical protein
MAKDTPNINLSLAALEAEVDTPEPFVFALKGGKRITFPDIFDMPLEEATQFLDEVKDIGDDLQALEKWLSPEDFAKYKDAKLSLRIHRALVDRVTAYYEGSPLGDAGNGGASANS